MFFPHGYSAQEMLEIIEHELGALALTKFSEDPERGVDLNTILAALSAGEESNPRVVGAVKEALTKTTAEKLWDDLVTMGEDFIEGTAEVLD